jgi:hypothetical protein
LFFVADSADAAIWIYLPFPLFGFPLSTMYSQFLSDGEDSHRASQKRFLKGLAVGFGAGLLVATIVTVAFLPSTVPDSSAAEPSSLIAWPSVLRTAPSRGTVVYGWRHNKQDDNFAPKQGLPADSLYGQTQSYQPQFQQPMRSQPAQVAPGEYSQEQLEFLRRTGKSPGYSGGDRAAPPRAQTNSGWSSPADKQREDYSGGFSDTYHNQMFK